MLHLNPTGAPDNSVPPIGNILGQGGDGAGMRKLGYLPNLVHFRSSDNREQGMRNSSCRAKLQF